MRHVMLLFLLLDAALRQGSWLPAAADSRTQPMPPHRVTAPPIDPPDWFTAEMAALATDADVWWIADNSPFRSTAEPFTRYAIHWASRDQGRSLWGEMVAIDSAGARIPMWSYLMYWHPGEERAYLMQTSSWGAYAVGPMQRDSTVSGRLVENQQDLWQPDGTASRTRHRSWFETRDAHRTESFNSERDAWVPTRSYRWLKGRLE